MSPEILAAMSGAASAALTALAFLVGGLRAFSGFLGEIRTLATDVRSATDAVHCLTAELKEVNTRQATTEARAAATEARQSALAARVDRLERRTDAA